MNHFRRYLSGTEGEAACLFWLDVQRFLHKLHTGELDERGVVKFIKWIRTQYMNEDAPLRINNEIRTKLTDELCRLNPSVADNSRQYPQASSITRLSNTHSRHIEAITEAQTQVLTALKGYWCNIYAAKKNVESDLSDRMMESSKGTLKASHCLPDIPAHRGQSEYCHTTEIIPTAQHFVKLPDIHSPAIIGRAREVKRTVSSLDTKPLFTPSTAELFPDSNTPLSDAAQPAMEDCFHLAPFLSASLRADFLAGNPFLSYCSRHCPDSSAVNYLLFWHSAEAIFTADEMRRWYQRGRKQRVGVCPCNNHQDEFYPTAKTPTELVQLFLMKGAPHMIVLPCHHQERLSVLLPRGLGQSLLMSVQGFAAQVSRAQGFSLTVLFRVLYIILCSNCLLCGRSFCVVTIKAS